MSRFSVRLSDWGDFLPFGAAPSGILAATLTGYDAGGNTVASDASTISSTSNAISNRPSTDFGNLGITGDACSAA